MSTGGHLHAAARRASVGVSQDQRPTRAEPAAPRRRLARNVAKLVKPPEHTPRERETWSKAEVRKFLVKASADRL